MALRITLSCVYLSTFYISSGVAAECCFQGGSDSPWQNRRPWASTRADRHRGFMRHEAATPDPQHWWHGLVPETAKCQEGLGTQLCAQESDATLSEPGWSLAKVDRISSSLRLPHSPSYDSVREEEIYQVHGRMGRGHGPSLAHALAAF